MIRREFLVTKEKEMCSCLRSCFGSSPVVNKEFSNKREQHHHQEAIELHQEAISLSVSKQIKDISVRIVHAGGRIEMYQKAIPVSTLIHKYPGMCIARPEVFKCPHESTLSAGDILLPGNKYFIIPSTTMEKLKRRKLRKCIIKQKTDNDEPVEDVGDVSSEESICSVNDFLVTKDSWSKCASEKQVKGKKQFVPPIQKPRMWKEPEWEPSLVSIKELSP